MGTSYGRKCILFTACRCESVPSTIRGKPQAMVPESDLILTPAMQLTTRVDRHVFAALSPTPTAPATITSCGCQERHCALRIRRTSKESEARLRGSLCVGTGAEVCVSSRHPPLAFRHCDSGSAVASTLRLLAIAATALPSLPSCCLQWHAAESPRLGSTGRRLVLSSPSRRRRGPARRSSGQSVSLSEPTRDPHCMRARKAEPCHRPASPLCTSFYVRAFC